MHALPAPHTPPVAQRSQPAACPGLAPSAKRQRLHVTQATPRTAARPLQDRAEPQELERWWGSTDDSALGDTGDYWADADVGALPLPPARGRPQPRARSPGCLQLGADLDDPPEDVEVGENDAQSRALAVALAAVAQDTKAQVWAGGSHGAHARCTRTGALTCGLRSQAVSVLGVGHVVSWTSYFVVATVTSQPQMGAVLAKVANAARDSFGLEPLKVTDGRRVHEAPANEPSAGGDAAADA